MRRSHRSILLSVLGLLAAITVTVVPASALEPNTCISGKIACANAYSSAVLKCYAKICKTGFSSATQEKAEACVRKARSKFGTAVSSGLQCWDKIEGKASPAKPATIRPTGVMDEYDVDDLVKDFALDIVNDEVAPSGPSSLGNSCSAGKVACVGKLFKSLLGCEIKAHKAGVPTDEACIAKAIAKFDGGTVPSKGCFAKLEAKQKLGKPKTYCDIENNVLAAGGKAELFVAIVVVGLEPS